MCVLVPLACVLVPSAAVAIIATVIVLLAFLKPGPDWEAEVEEARGEGRRRW